MPSALVAPAADHVKEDLGRIHKQMEESDRRETINSIKKVLEAARKERENSKKKGAIVS